MTDANLLDPDVNRIEAPVTWKAYLICAFASFGGIFFGYDVSPPSDQQRGAFTGYLLYCLVCFCENANGTVVWLYQWCQWRLYFHPSHRRP
jgi:hypothetical protein